MKVSRVIGDTARAVRSWCCYGALVTCLLQMEAYGAVTLTPLFSFNGTNGAVPEATLMQGTDGKLYGTTMGGGTNDFPYGGDGTIFRVSTNGSFESVVSFERASAANPQSGLLPGQDGAFYGITYSGGAGGIGAAYRLTANGAFVPLCSFSAQSGVYPHGLTWGANGKLYGTGYWGGTNSDSLGTVFELSLDGTLAALASFDGTNGANPQAPLLQGIDKNFYGTTVSGGTNGGWGTLFRITPDGELTTLVAFNGTNGASPMSALVQDAEGNIYGTTSVGGLGFLGTASTGSGTVFKLTPQGELITLHFFGGYPDDGDEPGFGGLVLAPDGNWYGTTQKGGAHGTGTVYCISPQGVLRVLYSFSDNDYDTGINPEGWCPMAGLVLANDGNFYGVAAFGGAYANGTVFRFVVSPEHPRLKAAGQNEHGLAFSWDTVPSTRYQVQSCSDLNSADWQNVGPVVVATNTITSASDSIGLTAQRFYRVLVLP